PSPRRRLPDPDWRPRKPQAYAMPTMPIARSPTPRTFHARHTNSAVRRRARNQPSALATAPIRTTPPRRNNSVSPKSARDLISCVSPTAVARRPRPASLGGRVRDVNQPIASKLWLPADGADNGPDTPTAPRGRRCYDKWEDYPPCGGDTMAGRKLRLLLAILLLTGGPRSAPAPASQGSDEAVAAPQNIAQALQ